MESKGVALDTELGYSFGGLSDELTYGGGVTESGAPSSMFSARFRGVGSFGRPADGDHLDPQQRRDDPAVVDRSSERTRHRGPGFKWNPAATWLVGANVLRRLTTGGLTAQWVPMVSIEYAFGG